MARASARPLARPPARPRKARARRRGARGLVRAILWGAPLALVAGLGTGAAMSGAAPAHLTLHDFSPQALGADVLSLTGRLGLTVNDIVVVGRSTTDTATILAALDARAGSPILGVSPARAKQQLEALPWVRSATIERRLPGTIYVHLVERQPLGVWQHDGGKFDLIDRDGATIPVADLSRFAKLPSIIGGDQARHGATQLLDQLAGEPQLAARITAVTLVGERRWNVRIDNTIDVLLPEDDIAGAWTKLAELQRTSQILQRDVETIDLRLPDRLVVRATDEAPKDAPKKNHPQGKPI